jgi:hypothetical protein
VTTAQIGELVEGEVRSIAQPDLAALARSLLVPPKRERRQWDYGAEGEGFECWVILEDPPSNTGIAYCIQGFGPSDPWGLVFLTGQHLSMGADDAWFASLEDAMRNWGAWQGANPPDFEVA